MTDQEAGVKFDREKIQLELLSPRWLSGVGAVLTFGAYKYAAHNWRKGIELSRLLGAALRHILAFLGGEDCDPETGLCHLYHASCCLMFACELWETRPELDNRFKVKPLPPFKWNAPAGRGLPHPKIDPIPEFMKETMADHLMKIANETQPHCRDCGKTLVTQSDVHACAGFNAYTEEEIKAREKALE